MLRLAILALLALAGTAHALVVIDEPPIPSACGAGKTWAVVNTCLARQGQVIMERALPRAKLVRIIQTENGQPIDQGVYLYLLRADGSWTIGGMFTGSGYTVLELAPLTLEKHTGYRVAIGQLVRTRTSVGGLVRLPVTIQTQRVLFCSGIGYGCPDTTTHCDVIYRGKALWTYRGALTFERGVVRNDGDRSRGGPVCQPGARTALGWPIPGP